MLTSIIAMDVRGELVSANVGEERVLASVHRILDDSDLCSMSTVTPDNHAHINIAYIAHAGELRLCFLSHPLALHCQNIAKNPSTAITVYNSLQHWGEPDRGLQLFGSCRMANESEGASAAQAYGQRFGQFKKWAASLSEGAAGLEYRLFWFLTEKLKVSDEREFGDGVLVTALVQR